MEGCAAVTGAFDEAAPPPFARVRARVCPRARFFRLTSPPIPLHSHILILDPQIDIPELPPADLDSLSTAAGADDDDDVVCTTLTVTRTDLRCFTDDPGCLLLILPTELAIRQ